MSERSTLTRARNWILKLLESELLSGNGVVS
jgi:hypothetical protein